MKPAHGKRAEIRHLKQRLDEIEKALLAEAACIDVLKLVAPVRRSIDRLMITVTETHLRTQISRKRKDGDDHAREAADIAEMVTRYLR